LPSEPIIGAFTPAVKPELMVKLASAFISGTISVTLPSLIGGPTLASAKTPKSDIAPCSKPNTKPPITPAFSTFFANFVSTFAPIKTVTLPSFIDSAILIFAPALNSN